MHDDERLASGWTAASLLAMARAGGMNVSASQLSRWHRSGLLPSPLQKGLGKGGGTVSVYPAGSDHQLSRLLALMSDERKLLGVGFQLWWEGFPVAKKLWWPSIVLAAGDLSGAQRRLIAARFEADDDGDEDGFDTSEFEQFKAVKTDSKILRQLRKRLDVGATETFFTSMFRIASGSWTPNSAHDPSDPDRLKDQDILRRGLGFHKTMNIKPDEFDRSKYEFIEEPLSNLASSLKGVDFFTRVTESSEPEIELARAEISSLLSILSASVDYAERASGPHAYGLRNARNLAQAPFKIKAQLVAMWISIGESGLMRYQTRRMLDEQEPVLGSLYFGYKSSPPG